jgi:hypothetical protein
MSYIVQYRKKNQIWIDFQVLLLLKNMFMQLTINFLSFQLSHYRGSKFLKTTNDFVEKHCLFILNLECLIVLLMMTLM